jgi:hypothetical protein
VPFIQQRRCKIIATTKGLSVWQGPETFAIVGGCQTIKSFVAPLITKDIFGGVLWIDEIGDAMRGHASDSSRVGGDQHGVMLSWMADKKIPAILGVGIAGTGKSEFGKALGNEAGRPTIRWDFGGMLGQYVGNSQDYIRNSIKVVEAVTASRPFIIATTNDTQSLSPQLLSRFMAVFYFDLPDREERKAIWKINLDKYGVTGNRLEGYDRLLPLEWTGREIYRCCQMTQLLDMDLDAASQFIVPVSDSQRETISSLRSQANGTWLSASYPGVYKIDRQREPRAAGERRISA